VFPIDARKTLRFQNKDLLGYDEVTDIAGKTED
jgi:hypothetical protein